MCRVRITNIHSNRDGLGGLDDPEATTEVGKKWKAGEEKGWQAINLDEMEKP